MYLSRNRNCSKVHWSKQVRCRRLATGRAGRLCLAANTPLPLLPIHLDFILHKDLQKCFIFVFLCLHFYISASSSSDGVYKQIPRKSDFWDNLSRNFVFFSGAYCVYWCLYESQYVILMILSDCPTDTYIGHSSFCIVLLMEPRPLFIRVRDGSI